MLEYPCFKTKNIDDCDACQGNKSITKYWYSCKFGKMNELCEDFMSKQRTKDSKEFQDFLDYASKTIKSWPEWKQKIYKNS